MGYPVANPKYSRCNGRETYGIVELSCNSLTRLNLIYQVFNEYDDMKLLYILKSYLEGSLHRNEGKSGCHFASENSGKQK